MRGRLFGVLWGSLGVPWESREHPWGSFGDPWGSLGDPLGFLGDPLGVPPLQLLGYEGMRWDIKVTILPSESCGDRLGFKM